MWTVPIKAAELENHLRHSKISLVAVYLQNAISLPRAAPCPAEIKHHLAYKVKLNISTISYFDFYCSAEDLSPDFRKVRILVNHDGHVHWEPGGVFTTTCDIDIRYFPFDDQLCPIQIGAWAYYR